jgi:predicted transposase/invertase (TIGR01784 family)
MRTDTIFYQIFQTLPGTLFELIGEAIDVANDYEFKSVEVKELSFRIDGVFVPSLELSDRPIYFVEVQFQKDEDFYWRLFGEIFIFLKQYKPIHDWRAVVVYPSRNADPELPMQYRGLQMAGQVQQVYLDELPIEPEQSLGVKVAQLVVVAEEMAVEQARQLMQQTQQDLTNSATQAKVLELIQTIIAYKLGNKSRQELEAMFTLDDLKKTRLIQEIIAEEHDKAKLETVPKLLDLGLTLEKIAEVLDLDIEVVRQAASH